MKPTGFFFIGGGNMLNTRKLEKIIEKFGGDTSTLETNLESERLDVLMDMEGGSSGGGGAEEYWDLTTRKSGGVSYYIKKVPMIDTSQYTTTQGFFSYCSSLVEVPLLNTSNVTNMQNMFQACSVLETIPKYDTSRVTNMNGMFQYCSKLKTIPLLDTQNVTNMGNMFFRCFELEEVPLLNTSKVTNMDSMFYECKALKEIPQIDTSKVTTFGGLFQNCSALETLPLLDASSVVTINNSTFYLCSKLTNLGGFKDLGKAYLTSQSAGYNNYVLQLNNCNNLTHESLMNVINNLYDIASKGVKTQNLVLGATNLAKLTDEEKAIATNKGWVLS